MTAWSTWRARSFSSVCTIRSRYPDTKQYQNFERGDEIAYLFPREVVKPPRGPRIVGRAAAEGEASNLGDKRKRPARGVRRFHVLFERRLRRHKLRGTFGLPRSAFPIEVYKGSWACPPPRNCTLRAGDDRGRSMAKQIDQYRDFP